MINIVIPMAGRGSRFAKVGYEVPKPLIPVGERAMIELVIANLRPSQPHRFIFIAQNEHIITYELGHKLRKWAGENSILIGIDGVTEGAACTVLTAKEHINNESHLMIANSDQWIEFDIDSYLKSFERSIDGLIMTMKANDPKWSFIKYENNRVADVVEKKVISDEATVGIYNFRHGRDFVNAAERMIAKNLRVNNEFYVAPAYNQLIKEGHQIGFYNIGSELDGMYGLGTPEDLNKFNELVALRRLALYEKLTN
ncbi:MAG: hypothetical protein RJB66_1690 [Pseudomonadota bacterium]|jgi:NDP-sugar pyrophosphorylase family protein